MQFMHIVVCLREAADTTRAWIDAATNTLRCADVPDVVNPSDLTALECALSVKERYGATVTVLLLGKSAAAVRQCLAYGADYALLLTDNAFVGSDTLATGVIFAAAIDRLAQDAPVDMVCCGVETLDGATGLIGAGIANALTWRQLTAVVGVYAFDASARTVTVERVRAAGSERLRTTLPAVLTVAEDAPAIRQAALPQLMRALRASPEIRSNADLALDPAKLGPSGSLTRMTHTTLPPPRASGDTVAVSVVGLETAVATVVEQMVKK
jgi:electron transfer flavoprotein beta subunit